jgi:acetylornithine deacetylase/succinyl-diaminopimelate desuccinylase-like protein
MRSAFSVLAGFGIVVSASTATAMQVKDPVEIVRRHVERRSPEMVTELRDLVSIPNGASDRENIRRNADFLVAMLKKRGATARLIETAGPPIVYGEIGDPRLPTVLFYFHYDGQPAGDAGWTQSSPWTPVLRSAAIEKGGRVMEQWPAAGSRVDPEWRVYARSASDDKAPIVAFMAVLDAWREAGVPLHNRIKMIFEGDEEAGSAFIAKVVRDNRDLLAADLVVMADGPIHPSNRPTADFGMRGIVSVTLTVFGPVSPLHSGHYGNWAPNPAMNLAHLLASMKSPTGEVLVEGWEDDVVPPGPAEREAWAKYPHDDSTRRLQLQLGAVDGSGASRMELIARPSLNVRGLASLFTGAQARTLVPNVAVAELDLRLVSGNDPERQVAKLVRHIEGQGWTVVRDAPDSSTRVRSQKLVRVQSGDGYPAGRTPLSNAASKSLVAALASAGLGEPVVSPTMGGSGPSYVFTDILRAPFVALPTVNHDNNQHAANENIRLGNLFRSAQILAAAAAANLRPR